jgi:hypothetical protein
MVGDWETLTRRNERRRIYRRAERSAVMEPDFEVIKQEIAFRLIRQKQSLPEIYTAHLRKKRLNRTDNPSLRLLLSTSGLWLPVEGKQFLPAAAVKQMMARSDGMPIEVKTFSVFVADRKRSLQDHFGIYPLSAWSKQKHQYWDQHYCESFLSSIQENGYSSDVRFNHIAYTVREDVTIEELKACCNRVHLQFTQAILNPNHEYFKKLF